MQLPSDPEKRQKLINYVQEGAEETLIIQAANSHLKDMRKGVKEEFAVEPKDYNKLVKAWLDDTLPYELQSQASEFVGAYEVLKGVSSE